MKSMGVLGLGYVGLGLAVAFSKYYEVLAYDINEQRINELKEAMDKNNEIATSELQKTNLFYTTDIQALKKASFYIVTVSTPAYHYTIPDLSPLKEATKALSKVLKKGDIVVFESTVYPGTTEEICVPLLEAGSNLRCGVDFNVGYSPERINPGDKTHTLQNITKVIAANNLETRQIIHHVYRKICEQLHPVSSIAIAEAIKILENTQRDINIAFMNEFSQIMHAMDLNMHEIIEGAKTKWSFIPFKPGLVGGHCISIDPHYLAFRAREFGMHADMVLLARKINDNMTFFIIQELLKLSVKEGLQQQPFTIGLFGISYKENSVDVRNSLTFKLIKELREYGFTLRVHDPFEHPPLLEQKQHIQLEHFDDIKNLSAAIILVGHDYYQQIGLGAFLEKFTNKPLIMDIPNLFIKDHLLYPSLAYWSL